MWPAEPRKAPWNSFEAHTSQRCLVCRMGTANLSPNCFSLLSCSCCTWVGVDGDIVHHTLDINSFTGCPTWAWATLSLCLSIPICPLEMLRAAGKAVLEFYSCPERGSSSRFEKGGWLILLSQLSTWESSARNGLASVAFFQRHTECTLIAVL